MAALQERAAEIDPAQCRRTSTERLAPDRVAAGCEAV